MPVGLPQFILFTLGIDAIGLYYLFKGGGDTVWRLAVLFVLSPVFLFFNCGCILALSHI